MEIFRFVDGGYRIEITDSNKESLLEIHRIAEKYLSNVHNSKKLTTDMDGVLVHDDSAIIASNILAGQVAQELYGEYADKNLIAAGEGKVPYCWYAPTMFVGQLLTGLDTEINRVIGRNMRLIPGTEDYISKLQGLDYDITAVTAGHQEAAEEVSRKAGIEKTIATKMKSKDGIYTSEIERFVGGVHKLKHVQKILDDKNGTHIGDSWSDVETLEGIENSIAFNPGCIYALRNARISVIGTSQLALLPFFDYKGRYDFDANTDTLPEKIIIMEDRKTPYTSDYLLKESKNIKKETIPNILNKTTPTPEVEERIKRELDRLGIDYKTKIKNFMSPKEFDTYAKQEYAKYNNKS